MEAIGNITQVPVREAWQHEAHHFTPWLEKNIERLGEAINIRLESGGTEVNVGNFSADILANDEYGRTVLIENQLERTDHSHLGQIMTYLAGLEAKVIIWVATDFREEHLSAIQWLNDHTHQDFNFFAVQLRVIRIDNSLPAPMFEVLARPNEWERELNQIKREKTGEMSEIGKSRNAFWSHFHTLYPDDSLYGFKVTGRSYCWLTPKTNEQLRVVMYLGKSEVGVYMNGAEGVTNETFKALLEPYSDKFINALLDAKEIDEKRVEEIKTEGYAKAKFKINTTERDNWDNACKLLHNYTHKIIGVIDGALP